MKKQQYKETQYKEIQYIKKAEENRLFENIKKAAAAVISLCVCICAATAKANAADNIWDIENTLDKTECCQGDELLLSVTLEGSSLSKEQEILSLNGVLEYDTSLFNIAKDDILPSEKEAVKECTFDEADGIFSIQYSSGVKMKDTSVLMQIRLHVSEEAETGNTTLCVTSLEWSGADDRQSEKIEHHVPVYLTIREASKSMTGDVNGDGKVDLTDARLIMQQYNGEKVLDTAQEENADVNGDGRINLTDVKLIIQYYNEEIDEF